MIQQRARLKARRIFRSRKRQAGEFADTASKGIDKHVFKRIQNFAEVARFSIAWALLVIVLIGSVTYQTRGLEKYYLSYQPVAGGIYNEGMVGTFTNANPLFASNSVDLSVSRLIFNSILTYNTHGELVNDLAENVQKSDDGLTYTITLKSNVYWQDGEQLVSDDVVYTYQAIQNPDTRSPYNLSWRDIKVEAVDQRTVRFTLPSPLNSFPLSITNGIVPKHILGKVAFGQLRSSDYNASPIGSGPFRLIAIERVDDITSSVKKQRIELQANGTYFKGKPKLDVFVLHTYATDTEMSDALVDHILDGEVSSDYPKQLLEEHSSFKLLSSTMLGGTYVFMKTTDDTLASKELRQALVMGTDMKKVLSTLPYPVRQLRSPLLPTHIGYDASLDQLESDIAGANAKLDALGWTRNSTDIRTKDGKQLELSIATLQDSDLALVATALQSQWSQDLGVKLSVVLKSTTDNQTAILQHGYQMMLYGISMGADPDVYAYWHSSQAINERFNLSLYRSADADAALEAGRTRPDAALRAAKYRPFLSSWRDDAPAIGLYQPVSFYVTTGSLNGFDARSFNSVSDRFYEVEKWQNQISKQPIVKE